MSHEQECVERVIVAGINTASGGPAVVTSEDGVTWNEVVGFPGAGASQVSVAGGAFFIQTAAEYTANNYAYSYDGDYWQLGSAGAGAFCVARTDNYFVSLNSNVSVRSSTPPGPWGTNVGTGSGSGYVGRRLIHRSGRLVGAINFTATQPSIVVSDDEGATWTAVNATPGTGSSGTEPWVLFDMDYGAGRYVATVARPSAFLDRWIITSTNGLTWTTVSTGIPDQFPVAIRYGNGQFVAVGTPNSGPPERTYTSPDGLNWTMHTPTACPAAGSSRTPGWPSGTAAGSSCSRSTTTSTPRPTASTGGARRSRTATGAAWRQAWRASRQRAGSILTGRSTSRNPTTFQDTHGFRLRTTTR